MRCKIKYTLAKSINNNYILGYYVSKDFFQIELEVQVEPLSKKIINTSIMLCKFKPIISIFKPTFNCEMFVVQNIRSVPNVYNMSQ